MKEQIAEYIRTIAGRKEKTFVFGYIESVNKKTCSIRDEDSEVVYENIILSKGITIIPQIGSMAVACIVPETDFGGFLVFADEFQEIIHAGGENEGIVKVKELKDKLNALETEFNTLKNLFKTWVTVPQDGGASLKTILSSFAGKTLQLTKRSELENKTIKH